MSQFEDEQDEEYSWSLGDDYDCETCGFTYNTLRLQDFGDGVWVLSMSVGCYGGESAQSNGAAFDEVCESIITDCLRYEDFSKKNAKEVRAHLARIKTLPAGTDV